MKNWEDKEIKKKIKKKKWGKKKGVESSVRKAWGTWRQSLPMQDKGCTKDR